jgi:hypothetical protein
VSPRTRFAQTVTIPLVILLVGGVVRFWNLGWGLADSFAFPDEVLIWPTYFRSFIPLELASFLRPERFPAFVYPSGYGNLSGLLGAAAHALGFVPESSPSIFQVVYIARLVTASASLATVALVMLAGRTMFDRRTALVAGIFMALVPLCVFRAHYANVDSLLVMWVTAALIAAFFLAERGSTSAAILAGICTGFAFGTKYTGVAVGALVAWAVVEVAWKHGSWRIFLRLGVLSLCGCALGFFLACPACWIQSEYWLEALSFLSLVSSWDYVFFWRHHLIPSLGWYGRPYLYQLFASLPFSLGWPLYALAGLGVLRAIARRGLAERLLLVLLPLFLLPSVLGTSVVDAPRYLQPLVPALVLLSAHFLVTTAGRRVRLCVIAVVTTYSAIFALGQVSELNYRQQKELVEFLRAELPQRSQGKRPRVGLPDRVSPYYRIVTPLRAAGLAPRPLPAEEWFTADIDAFVLPETHVIAMRRSYPDRADIPAIERLESGESGWREAARWEAGYWAKSHYTALDPGFAADLLPGAQGFRVYIRDSEPTDRP